MADLRIGEAVTVQFPMIAHAVAIGWTALTPEVAMQKRGGAASMMMRDELGAALIRFNPWMSAHAAQQLIERLEAVSPTIEGNREMLAWLRGKRQWYDEAEKRHRPVQLIDFDRPGKNVFHITWEWKLKLPARKGNRADVMFIINGVPVCIVEHKNPKDGNAIDRGVTQLRRYEKETPELLGIPQLFNVTHLLDYWYGVTWNANRRFMARWKQQPEETYRFAVQAFFEPTDFLRTLRDWILFYVEDGETRKSILRQHQRIAIDKIMDRCDVATKRRGLIWHTQGSGKTFTLLTAACLILEDKARFRNATVILVVDRTEIDGQLNGWVDRLVGEMEGLEIPVWRANTKAEMQDLLKTDKRGLILSMIHKFEGINKDANTRDNIYVFIDEAHRSVANDLGIYMMAAVPNATIIGFTGTPIARMAQGEGTFSIFGIDDEQGYLDKYSIRESIEDETTLPIHYSMAPNEMTVLTEQLDKEFSELAAKEGITDVEELNRVLDHAVGLRTFLTADDRIEKVSAFVARHFKENVMPLGYKAFLVGVNREACAKYKRALDGLLPPEWSQAIYTENAADVVERPLVAELQISPKRQAELQSLFKKPDENPKILIVTDKLLTGYDAPLLYCMYLDKPMRDHVLLQAIARINRPYIDAEGVQKHVGLVIDFVGVLRDLKKALRFDSADVSGVIEDLDVLFKDFFVKIEQARKDYLLTEDEGSIDEKLEKLIYDRFLAPESRKAFFDAYKEIEVLWEILSPSPELRDHIATFKRLAQLYSAVRNAYANRVGYIAGLTHKTRVLVEERVTQEYPGALTGTLTFDAKMLDGVREEPRSYEGKVFNLFRGLEQEVEDNADAAPFLRPLKDRAELILKDLENRKITGLAAMNVLTTLAKEKEEAIRAAEDSGLSARAFGIYWNLKDDEALRRAGVPAMELACAAETETRRFPNAKVNDDERRRLRAALYSPLLGLGTEDRGRVVDMALTILLDGGGDADS